MKGKSWHNMIKTKEQMLLRRNRWRIIKWLLLTSFVTDGVGRRYWFLVAQKHTGAPLKGSTRLRRCHTLLISGVMMLKRWLGNNTQDVPCHSWGSCPLYRRCAAVFRPCWWRWRRCPSLPGSSGAGRAALGGRWWRCAARWPSCCWRWRSGRTAWPGWPRSPGSDVPCPRTEPWWTPRNRKQNILLHDHREWKWDNVQRDGGGKQRRKEEVYRAVLCF